MIVTNFGCCNSGEWMTGGLCIKYPLWSVLWSCYFDFGVGNSFCWCKWSLWRLCDECVF